MTFTFLFNQNNSWSGAKVYMDIKQSAWPLPIHPGGHTTLCQHIPLDLSGCMNVIEMYLNALKLVELRSTICMGRKHHRCSICFVGPSCTNSGSPLLCALPKLICSSLSCMI